MENSPETMFASTPFAIEGQNYKSNATLVAERKARDEDRRVKIVILQNDFDEYQVPDESGFYFTDDRDDAIGTACAIYGANVQITFRRVAS